MSQSPQTSIIDESNTHRDVTCYTATIMEGIPASPSKMASIRAATATNRELQTVIQLIQMGWPEHASKVPPETRAYMKMKNELSQYDGLQGSRLVVPQALSADILQKIH